MRPIEFDAIIFQEGKSYVAYCSELDVPSCGKDLDEARKNLKTAVRLIIEETEKIENTGRHSSRSRISARSGWNMEVSPYCVDRSDVVVGVSQSRL